MTPLQDKLLVFLSTCAFMIGAFFVGSEWQKWKTTDRLETFDGASRACEHVIQHNDYLKTHPEGNLLGDCIKYVMKEGN